MKSEIESYEEHYQFEPYMSFDRKNEFFNGNTIVENSEHLTSFLEELYDYYQKEDQVWRGVSEAKVKLHNSAHRYFHQLLPTLSNEHYHDFIINLVNYVSSWNDSSVQSFLSVQEIKNDVVAILGLMQHFKVPSPLLDFSSDPFVALYFSTYKNDYDKSNSILNYSSLYAFDSTIQSVNSFNLQYNINHSAYEDQFTPLLATPFLLIKQTDPEFRVANNPNIVNQKGLFLYSNHSSYPVEYYHYKLTKEKEEDTFGIIPVQKKNLLLKCWNIHKSLNPMIRTILKRQYGIDEEYLFPNFYNILDDFQKGKR